MVLYVSPILALNVLEKLAGPKEERLRRRDRARVSSGERAYCLCTPRAGSPFSRAQVVEGARECKRERKSCAGQGPETEPLAAIWATVGAPHAEI